ncbi:MAG: isopentenyl-diphosphate Delta-isomerase [Bacteroidota bacterium]
MEYVILVDRDDRPLGKMEKMEAHEKGLLHRAFSIFLFNKKAELMLQQRAYSKYHSGGLWTNTCCSHPRADEELESATSRRLQEELGISAEVTKAFSFIYRAELDKKLIEHEFDHVFLGEFDGIPVLNKEEVADFRYISKKELEEELAQNPDKFTEWFKIALPEVISHWPDPS